MGDQAVVAWIAAILSVPAFIAAVYRLSRYGGRTPIVGKLVLLLVILGTLTNMVLVLDGIYDLTVSAWTMASAFSLHVFATRDTWSRETSQARGWAPSGWVGVPMIAVGLFASVTMVEFVKSSVEVPLPIKFISIEVANVEQGGMARFTAVFIRDRDCPADTTLHYFDRTTGVNVMSQTLEAGRTSKKLGKQVFAMDLDTRQLHASNYRLRLHRNEGCPEGNRKWAVPIEPKFTVFPKVLQ